MTWTKLLTNAWFLALICVFAPATHALEVSKAGSAWFGIPHFHQNQRCFSTRVFYEFNWSLWTILGEPVQFLGASFEIPDGKRDQMFSDNRLPLPIDAGPCASIRVSDVPSDILKKIEVYGFVAAGFVDIDGKNVEALNQFIVLDAGIPGKIGSRKPFNVPEAPDPDEFVFDRIGLHPSLEKHMRSAVNANLVKTAIRTNTIIAARYYPYPLRARLDLSALHNWWYENNRERLAFVEWRELVYEVARDFVRSYGHHPKLRYNEMMRRMRQAESSNDYADALRHARSALGLLREADRLDGFNMGDSASQFRRSTDQKSNKAWAEESRLYRILLPELKRYTNWANQKREELSKRKLPEEPAKPKGDSVSQTAKWFDLPPDLWPFSGVYGDRILLSDGSKIFINKIVNGNIVKSNSIWKIKIPNDSRILYLSDKIMITEDFLEGRIIYFENGKRTQGFIMPHRYFMNDKLYNWDEMDWDAKTEIMEEKFNISLPPAEHLVLTSEILEAKIGSARIYIDGNLINTGLNEENCNEIEVLGIHNLDLCHTYPADVPTVSGMMWLWDRSNHKLGLLSP